MSSSDWSSEGLLAARWRADHGVTREGDQADQQGALGPGQDGVDGGSREASSDGGGERWGEQTQGTRCKEGPTGLADRMWEWERAIKDSPSVFGLSHGARRVSIGPHVGDEGGADLRSGRRNRGYASETLEQRWHIHNCRGVRSETGAKGLHSSKHSLNTCNVPFGQTLYLISFLSFNACLVQYNAVHWQLSAQYRLALACLPQCGHSRDQRREVLWIPPWPRCCCLVTSGVLSSLTVLTLHASEGNTDYPVYSGI